MVIKLIIIDVVLNVKIEHMNDLKEVIIDIGLVSVIKKHTNLISIEIDTVNLREIEIIDVDIIDDLKNDIINDIEVVMIEINVVHI